MIEVNLALIKIFFILVMFHNDEIDHHSDFEKVIRCHNYFLNIRSRNN